MSAWFPVAAGPLESSSQLVMQCSSSNGEFTFVSRVGMWERHAVVFGVTTR